VANQSTDLVSAWPAQTVIERLKTCRIMLYQHGMLTDSECKRVDQRIDKREATLTALKETP
jgi:hypothetical protein